MTKSLRQFFGAPLRPTLGAAVLATLPFTAMAQDDAKAQDDANTKLLNAVAGRVLELEDRLDSTDEKLDAMLNLLEQIATAPAPAAAAQPVEQPAAPAAAQTTASAPAAAPEREIVSGYLLRVAGLVGTDVSEVSQSTLGLVHATDETLVFQKASEYAGFQIGDLVGYEMQGFLPVEQAGNTSFIINYSFLPKWKHNWNSYTCEVSVKIGDTEVIRKREVISSAKPRATIAQAADLPQGEYDFSMWTACHHAQGKGYVDGIVTDAKIVLPGTNKAVPLSKVLYVERVAS